MDPKTNTPTTDTHPEWCDPFCEPKTIPAGWDVSEILPASTPQVEDEVAHH